ncbi:aminotransferase [Rhodococcoides trifolii]|uniref:Aminotransferase n=1 Tax=Rhodococcoides trifolii TaxID=908250 RepID=A0A917D8K8_9NOCA|nr:PLP-dependent aminotransferase family protein [Rhodococcus trifolii]GGG13096.1 aminotransferase [Rhodococcus trifolii]
MLPPLAHRTSQVRGSAIRDLLTLTARDDVISLAGGLPAPELMPHRRIRDAASRAFDAAGVLQYSETSGVRRLRAVIAERETRRTGSPVDVASVVVTHGSQQALSLLGTVLIDPGDVVIVDAPAYTGALQVFAAAGAEIRAVPVDANGTDIDALEALLGTGVRPRIVHTVSNFHNPRGVTLSAGRRQGLADLADRYGFWMIEDDPYGEIWFDAPPPEPIHSDRVVRLGSASKILAPTLRVGWMTAPYPVAAAVELFKQGADLCGSSLTQTVAADLLDDTEWLDEHLGGLRRAYRSRCRALTGALTSAFGSSVEFDDPTGGMFVWAAFTDGTDTSAMLSTATDHGVAYVPGAAFGSEPAFGHAARLCFATVDESVAVEAVDRLYRAHQADVSASR